MIRIQSETGKVENKVEELKILGQKTGNISDIGHINSPGQRIGQIVLYDLEKLVARTGDNISM